jgi:hypothetical protein
MGERERNGREREIRETWPRKPGTGEHMNSK